MYKKNYKNYGKWLTFRGLFLVGLQTGWFAAIALQPAAAQNPTNNPSIPTNQTNQNNELRSQSNNQQSNTQQPNNQQSNPQESNIQEFTPANQDSQLKPAPPPGNADVIPFDASKVAPQFTRYFLGPGDTVSIQVQPPFGKYRLGRGDGISVIVQRFPDLGFQAAINPEGNVVGPLIGSIPLQNLTIEEAQQRLRAAFNRYVVEPTVIVALATPRQNLLLSALVNPEGNISLPQLGNVSVQGLTLEEAQEKVRLEMAKIFTDPLVTVTLMSPRPVQVTVNGEVFRPGIYPIGSPNPRVTDVLLSAGGTTMMADLRQVQVRRRLADGTLIAQNLDLYSSLQNGGMVQNLRLQDGDAVVIPRREVGADDGYDRNLVARSSLAVPQIRVRVLNYAAGGLVTQTLANGSTFVDAIAGISPENANINDIALIRFDPERGRAVTIRLNAKRALSGDLAQNVPLQDNDVIVVGRSLLGKVTNLLTTITRPFFDVQSFLRFFETLGGGTDSGR